MLILEKSLWSYLAVQLLQPSPSLGLTCSLFILAVAQPAQDCLTAAIEKPQASRLRASAHHRRQLCLCSSIPTACRLGFHTFLVLAAVHEDFAESILEQDMQSSAREGTRTELLATVEALLADATFSELVDGGISSCLASYKALLAGLQTPVPLCLGASIAGHSSSDALVALSSRDLAYSDHLSVLRTALRALLSPSAPSNAHRRASQVVLQVGDGHVTMFAVLCSFGVSPGVASCAWVRATGGEADSRDVHVQARSFPLQKSTTARPCRSFCHCGALPQTALGTCSDSGLNQSNPAESGIAM